MNMFDCYTTSKVDIKNMVGKLLFCKQPSLMTPNKLLGSGRGYLSNTVQPLHM